MVVLPGTPDITIIGAGPTGLYAAFYAGLRSMQVRIVDSLSEIGGQLTALYPKKNIYDVAGYPAVLAEDLVKSLYEQCKQYNPEIYTDTKIEKLEREGELLKLTSADGRVMYSKTVLIAAGVGAFTPRKLEREGIEKWEGKGLYYFVKDPTIFYGKKLLVVGGGDSAMDWAMALGDKSDMLLIHRRDKFVAHEDSVKKVRAMGIPIRTFWELKEIHGEISNGTGKIDHVVIFNNKTKEEERIKVDAVLCNLGFITNLGSIKDWGLEIEGNGIKVNHAMETNIKGVYAAGDIASHPAKLKLIATGFGEAAIAVNHAKTVIDPHASFFPGHSSNKDDKKEEKKHATA
ncbi:MAG: NAD(P)/FAD-dependent oxidoreductase [Chloroherpetonaceae bacterium]|nr:NAD(P)/FAD-dependent oxidoreductase [Chloroherpetonaceae bacterium]MDW8436725.1 NAD(P)/FAD-dependent oxidoreductase [Chloroherpetonaceae bacterium]